MSVVPHWVDLVLVFGMVLVQAVFVAAYQARTGGRWRRSVTGWHLMAIAVADALPFLHLAAAVLWPWLARLGWFQWTYRGSFALMIGVTAWRVVMVFVRPADAQAPVKKEVGT